jgi:hypothetical protein
MSRDKATSVRSARRHVMRPLNLSLALVLACACSDSIAASADESLHRCPAPLNYRSAMPELIPPETDSNPSGWADLALTINAAGTVTDATVTEWRISPNKPWIRDWLLSGIRNLQFDRSQTTRRCILHYRFTLVPNSH